MLNNRSDLYLHYSEDDDARLGFNEDGSFIGQYYKKDPRGPAAPNYENTDSNV